MRDLCVASLSLALGAIAKWGIEKAVAIAFDRVAGKIFPQADVELAGGEPPDLDFRAWVMAVTAGMNPFIREIAVSQLRQRFDVEILWGKVRHRKEIVDFIAESLAGGRTGETPQ